MTDTDTPPTPVDAPEGQQHLWIRTPYGDHYGVFLQFPKDDGKRYCSVAYGDEVEVFKAVDLKWSYLGRFTAAGMVDLLNSTVGPYDARMEETGRRIREAQAKMQPRPGL